MNTDTPILGSFVRRLGSARPGDLARVGASIGTAVALAVSLLLFLRSLGVGDTSAAEASRSRDMICAETGRVFKRFEIREGMTIPATNPRTGRATLYRAEKCYWTREGGVKLEPTYVVLSESQGLAGPTLCPDCGREVVPHNPLPPAELMREARRR